MNRNLLTKEAKFITDPKLRELNETLMRFQNSTHEMGEAISLAQQSRLAPQPEITQAGYKARPGLFLPVSAETTILLTKPTPDTAGQPLAIYNSSGGVVLLDPIDCTLNGADVGWLSPGLTILLPDASGWFGANTRAVELMHTGTLAGVTTGALTAGGITDADPLDLNRLLVAMFVIQAAMFAQTPTISTQPTVGLTDLAGNTTVVGRFVHAFANMLPDWQTGSLGIVHPDETNDLLGLAVLLSGARQNHRIRRNATTFTATSTSLELTTTYPGALIIDMIANDDATDTATPGTGQTALANGSAGGATVSLQASYKPMPRPGTTTMSWSALTNAANKAHIAIVIEPAEGV